MTMMLRQCTAAVALLAATILLAGSTASADPETEARQALAAVFDALMSGDPGKVEPLLAPEFQIVRSDGAGYGKDDYLARSIPKIETAPLFSDMVVTRSGDIMVVRTTVRIEEQIDGKKAESVFPHLFVFRETSEGWQVVAAANFAKLEDQAK